VHGTDVSGLGITTGSHMVINMAAGMCVCACVFVCVCVCEDVDVWVQMWEGSGEWVWVPACEGASVCTFLRLRDFILCTTLSSFALMIMLGSPCFSFIALFACTSLFCENLGVLIYI